MNLPTTREHACTVCEATFTQPVTPGRPALYCSDDCRAVARKARRYVEYEKRRAFRAARAEAWRAQFLRPRNS